MASNVRPDDDAAAPAETAPAASAAAETSESAPDRVTLMRQADHKLQQAEMKLQQAEMLLNVSRRVAAIESLDAVLKALVEMIAFELGAERASLFMNDGATGELYSRVAQGNFSREIRMLNTTGIAVPIPFVTDPPIIHSAIGGAVVVDLDAASNRECCEQWQDQSGDRKGRESAHSHV